MFNPSKFASSQISSGSSASSLFLRFNFFMPLSLETV
jgi:hypothetical protein